MIDSDVHLDNTHPPEAPQTEGAAGASDLGVKTNSDADASAAASRKANRRALLREDLSPQSFREDHGQALVACFELVNDALATARDTEKLLALAAHGEHGLVNQVRKVVSQAQNKIQSSTDISLNKYKADLAGAASITLESVVDVMQILREETKHLAAQRQDAAAVLVQLQELQSEIQTSVQVLVLEREHKAARDRKPWLARLLNR